MQSPCRAGQDHRGPLVQQWQRLLHCEQQATHVCVERFVELLLGDLPQCGEFVNPGIYREHIDTPGARLNSGIDAVEVGEVGDIALNRCGIAADRGDGLIQLRLTAANNKYARAFFNEVVLRQPNIIKPVILAPRDLIEDFTVEPVRGLTRLWSVCGSHTKDQSVFFDCRHS